MLEDIVVPNIGPSYVMMVMMLLGFARSKGSMRLGRRGSVLGLALPLKCQSIAAVRDEATRPVINVVEAFRAGVRLRARLIWSLFQDCHLPRSFVWLQLHLPPLTTFGVNGNAGTWS